MHLFALEMLSTVGLSQLNSEAQNSLLTSHLAVRNPLSYHLLPLWMCVIYKLGLAADLGLKPRPWDRGYRYPKLPLHFRAK